MHKDDNNLPVFGIGPVYVLSCFVVTALGLALDYNGNEKPYVFGVHHRVYRDFDNDGQLGATHIAYYILGCVDSGIKAYGRKMVARKIRRRVRMLL